jgi:hypothetical protein
MNQTSPCSQTPYSYFHHAQVLLVRLVAHQQTFGTNFTSLSIYKSYSNTTPTNATGNDQRTISPAVAEEQMICHILALHELRPFKLVSIALKPTELITYPNYQS